MIQAKNLNHHYGRFHALKNINFTLPDGAITGLIGQNGAGKSTLLKILAGYLVPSTGEILVDGQSFFQYPIEVRQKIGYMPESPILYRDMRVSEYLIYVGRLKGLPLSVCRQDTDRLIEQCGLKKVHYKLVGNLSKGNRQRVAMAQALMGSPSVLLLDEPTSAMDPAQVIEIRQFIRSLTKNALVLMSSHILSEIEQICDHIVCIRSGEVLFEGSLHTLHEKSDHGTGEFTVRLSDFNEEWIPLFRAIPGAALHTHGGKELVFNVSNSEVFVPSLIHLASRENLPLREMQWGHNYLESLFRNEGQKIV